MGPLQGLIVKTLDSTYEPSRRSVNWLKLKKDYMTGIGDTFDVVPIGAWFGKYGPLNKVLAGDVNFIKLGLLNLEHLNIT